MSKPIRFTSLVLCLAMTSLLVAGGHGPIDTGPDGICATPALAPDDVQIIAVGNGAPNGVVIDTGPDGVCSTVAAGDDAQLIPLGQGFPFCIAIQAGPNDLIDTTAGGDDQITLTGLGEQVLNTGLDGVLQSVLLGDDVAVIAFGQGQPNRPCVDSGANGFCQTHGAGDDAQTVPIFQGVPFALCVAPGLNGTGESPPRGDDVALGHAATFVRTDCDGDQVTTIADAIALLAVLFPAVPGQPQPLPCQAACDMNDDGNLNIADAVSLLTYLFGPCTGSLPPAPFEGGCGADPTADLPCDLYDFCP